MGSNVVGLVQTSAQAERIMRALESDCGCQRAQIDFTPVGGRGESGIRVERGIGGDYVLRLALEGAALGGVLGGLLGLVAGLIPLVDAGPIASMVTGAALGAIAGALMRGFMGEAPRESAEGDAAAERSVITVRAASEEAADCAANIMRAHGAIDVEQRPGASMEEQRVVPLAEEELAVGKREVPKGGVCIHTRVASVPAEKTVELREERAVIERRPVDRAASADEGLFTEQTFEVLEMAEEAVVQKRTRVKEEVRVLKQTSQHTETVRDSVRKTEVDVERSYGGLERRRHNGPYSGQERRAQLRAI